MTDFEKLVQAELSNHWIDEECNEVMSVDMVEEAMQKAYELGKNEGKKENSPTI